jgi:outer membrane protein assembly factor BamB
VRLARRGLVAFALLAASGCARGHTPAFDPTFPDNDAARGRLIAARLASASPAITASEPLLVATSEGAEPTVFAYDIAKAAVRWRVALRAESRPELLGDLVMSTSGGELVALDRAIGALRWRAPIEGCAYLGAARDGDRLFAACAGAGATRASSVLAFDANSGRALWRRDAQGEVGRPAARDGVVLVPWQHQNLTLLDARDGRELLRLRSEDDVIDWVRADARGTFFGQRALYRLGSAGYAGKRDGASFVATHGEALPANPSAMESAFSPQPGTRSARGRIALHLEPEAIGAGGVRIAYDRYYFVFYRYVFAYDASGALRWSRLLDRDAIAGQALAAGLGLALEDGQVLLLAQDNGDTLLSQRTGVALGSATLSLAGLPAPAAARGEAPEAALRHGLTAIALDTDSRLVPARAYAVQRLAALTDPEVTRELLDVYSQSSTPPDLKRAVADALRTRRTGLEYLIDALLARYDFLDQTRPAPLAVIVPALVDAHETRAVPNLITRLRDHETPSAVVPALVHAIAVLGDDSAVPPVLAWLRMYRADSALAEQPDALIEAARFVAARGGAAGAVLLTALSGDGRANPALAAGIAALTAERAPSAAHEAPAEPVAAAAPTPALPDKLDQAAINAVFAEHAAELRACADDELARNPKLGQIRVAFIAESDGSTHALSFAPNSTELADCLYAKVASYRFPRFHADRQVATFTMNVREPAAPVAPAAPSAQPWWAVYAARAQAPAADAEPWWQGHQWLAPQMDLDTATAAHVAPAAASQAPNTTAAPAPAHATDTTTSSAATSARPPAAAPAAPTVTPPAPAASSAPVAPEVAASPAPAAPAASAPQTEDAWWVPAGSQPPAPSKAAPR